MAIALDRWIERTERGAEPLPGEAPRSRRRAIAISVAAAFVVIVIAALAGGWFASRREPIVNVPADNPALIGPSVESAAANRALPVVLATPRAKTSLFAESFTERLQGWEPAI